MRKTHGDTIRRKIKVYDGLELWLKLTTLP